MEDRYTFGDSCLALGNAYDTTLNLRRAGFKTHLETHTLAGYVLNTVVAAPAPRPNRAERGCSLSKPTAPYIAQAQRIAQMYNAVAQTESRPDLQEEL